MDEHRKEERKKKKDDKARGVDASDFDISNTIEEGVEVVPSQSEKKRKEKRKKRESEIREDNEVVNEETLNSFGSEDGTSEKVEEKCESGSGNNEKKMKKEKKNRKSNGPLGINCSENQKKSDSERSSDFSSSKETTDSLKEEKKNKGREKNGKHVASSSLNTSGECSDSRGDEGCEDLANNNTKGKRRREDDSFESDKYEHSKTKKVKQDNKEMEKTSVPANGEDVTTKRKKATKVEVDQRASKLGKGEDANNLMTSKSRKNKRRVTFSDKVEVFPADKNTKCEEVEGEGKLVQGKRFSKEEDELVKQAVMEYIDTNQLGEEGVHMIMKCKLYPQIKNCWKVIGASLPWRPQMAVYERAHILFQRSESRKWEPEEYEFIKRFHKEHGPKWVMLADALGKHRFHVKDAWRRTRLPKSRTGRWSQEEYQTLFDLVNLDLRIKAFDEKKSKHGMLRDNIAWEAISEKLATRHFAACCTKWYNQLSSPLVHEGLWVDSDDYLLVAALQKLDACCEEDVDWDNLLEHRSGDVCKKRWKQMTKHIGGFQEKSFIEQVDLLSKRYCPEMLEYRR